ncbi:CatA-like O-acetyltransferase [Vibrio renipiscarius]|uniref:Chloramphenicol acetyltransferase n=1 Tax=Vibrio renipiscarius TaxID=1461322 RepID=A0A0C2NQA7_9VIBR|nr:CatA-like O-acetyltransferase [Vibrio renipiscarius]KII76362.1 chloramphenicol acetyltransferase [Vibrio renipiscarius]KII78115.1 chloramphenicol acetyltransferase [Vibrio renipiscarius]
MAYQVLDVTQWARAEHFRFYQGFSHPWYNICANIDVSALHRYCKQHHHRFFHAYLYLTQQALNQCEPMAYRLVGDEVRIYSPMQVSVALLAADDTVRFCDLDYQPQFEQFTARATETETRIKNTPFILEQFIGQEMKQDTIHLTVLPWIDFTSMSHARDVNFPDSVPKMAFGKLVQQGEQWRMPLSLEVHHGLMDGLHVGQFIQTLQTLFNTPSLLDPC